jgi:hypothetical protein
MTVIALSHIRDQNGTFFIFRDSSEIEGPTYKWGKVLSTGPRPK